MEQRGLFAIQPSHIERLEGWELFAEEFGYDKMSREQFDDYFYLIHLAKANGVR